LNLMNEEPIATRSGQCVPKRPRSTTKTLRQSSVGKLRGGGKGGAPKNPGKSEVGRKEKAPVGTAWKMEKKKLLNKC